ncbi:snake venom serine protease CL2-like [Leptidea sinapis]|uniref:snake venom serine protease CL2-like n=1 Tax=Leptidea sinapis TaxID=189913 RepID=UPI002139E0AA|nr:snake venom serine protease CL2-like [Leptidea sinapis]
MLNKLLCLLAVIAFSYAQAATIESRISDGPIANATLFRHVVSIQRTDVVNQINGHICGGSLVTFSYVVTAARCLFTDGSILLSTSQLRVVATSQLNSIAAANTRSVANYTVHGSYTGPPAYVNDIAMIALVTPFTSQFASLVPLPGNNVKFEDYAVCYVAGFGATSVQETSPNLELRSAIKYIYNQDVCKSHFNGSPGSVNILFTMVCAASINMRNVGCQGDEGNGLICNGVLAGVLSATDNCLATSLPEVYTRVTEYSGWIRSISGAPAISPTSILIAFSILLYFKLL